MGRSRIRVFFLGEGGERLGLAVEEGERLGLVLSRFFHRKGSGRRGVFDCTAVSRGVPS